MLISGAAETEETAGFGLHESSPPGQPVSHTVSRDEDSVFVCVWIRTHTHARAHTHTHQQASCTTESQSWKSPEGSLDASPFQTGRGCAQSHVIHSVAELRLAPRSSDS